MSASGLHPYILDVLRVYRHEIEPEEASALIAKAGLKTGLSLLKPDVEDAEHPERPTLQLWFELWRLLAHERPDLFRPNAKRLDLGDPYMLAFAYARKREPTAVPALRLTGSERRRAREGRALLHQLTGLAGFSRPCRAYVISPDAWPTKPLYQPLVHRPLQAANAWALIPHACAFPRVIQVDERFVSEARAGIDFEPDALVSTLLHEEIHWAVAATVQTVTESGPVGLVLQEPAATLGTLWVEYMLDYGEHHTGEQLSERVNRGYEHCPQYAAAVQLLIGDDVELDDGFLAAIKIAQIALTVGEDVETLARELSRVTGRDVTADSLNSLLD